MGVFEAIFVIIVVCAVVLLSFKITRQYERAVLFRLGKLIGERGPGMFPLLFVTDRIVRVDLRVRQLDVPKQTIITKDNISVDVDAIIYYHVTDACQAVVEVEDYEAATALIAQTTLRDVLGQNELDTILSERDSLNQEIQEEIKKVTEPWGVSVDIVTIRDVSVPENMLRAIARQAEAEREKRARIILAEGEFQASERMCEAAEFYEKTPAAMKLREFQTLTEIAKERNLIVVTTGTEKSDCTAATAAGLVKAFER
ncbi:regulator of protease activity HflC (stomatin/prohibitin superfamily) [Methanomicrobium sp. W14]|uniref:slipin family protein n=1 Tax=Methanomicrobium sp. W14 TaxID=2817839 RepID=UPI001AE2FF63|nr:slipin family protein [Methanomicrobium sp. W14]MBP2134032.1 regulator of protease activity HflC (stomatin/prohibitin superfamily) [Methanomicrobium sp. W14]